MVRTVVGSLVVAAVMLTGCTATSDGTAAGSSATVGADARAQALWAHRTAYVGDNSKVIALVGDAGFGPAGTFTLSLWTTSKPYAVTIALSDPAKPVASTDFTAPATLLLGTVTNLDAVHVTAAGQTFSLTSAQASTALGHDVKTLGTDRAALDGYLRSLTD
ncbi:hypothetical protein GCM10009868_19440 [Terrabacter aerolatus]|uniref:DUF4825 domain-containing protein n=1 Tax=Terrabacter aerolatus TaxID=422442 RepID=A0A512D026_9MICO|nr:DUF4825 domain-containing protein [Terrabacter aerolatus]GEO29815.1 hypothetical protein TAE01_16250 [Terrabacter aerolatus]